MIPPLVSLRDIARQAGVHYTTVSRALNNDPRLPESTRSRIRDIAAKMGYHSNPLVSSLISNLKRARLPPQFGVIGFLDTLSRPSGPARRSPTGHPFYEGARQRAAESGYRMDLFQLHTAGMSARRMKDILQTRAIRGLIIDSHIRPRGHLSLDVSPFATVMRGYSNLRPNLNRVSHNHFQGILLAIHALRHLGYRRIGLALDGELDRLTNNQWSAGFHTYQRELPSAMRVPPLLSRGPLKPQIGRWRATHRPDAILGADPFLLDWLEELRLAVPEQIGFASLDLDSSPQREAAGIWQSMDMLGAAAVDVLTTQMQRNESGAPPLPRVILQEGSWKDGPTVRRQESRPSKSHRPASP